MKKTSNESRLGRFSYLLKGGAKPRRSFALMMALVLVGMLSLAGVVSADNYYNGTPPQINDLSGLSGTVNGSVEVLFNDTWKTSSPIDYDDAWANFTLPVADSATTPIQFARLYVVVYTGNMNLNYKGNFSVTLKDGAYSSYAYPVVHKALDLDYDRIDGTSYAPVSGVLKNLSRTTSDYVAIIDVKDTLTAWDNTDFRVHLETWNESIRLQEGLTKFDGRIKEVKLVYGYNTTTNPVDVHYWLNEGNDPVTKKLVDPYTANQTVFRGVIVPDSPTSYVANLWVDFVAGNSTSGPGYGNYWWYDADGTETDLSPGEFYPPMVNQGVYAGLNNWTWDRNTGITISSGNNVLAYSRTNDYYKMIFALFTIKY